MSFPSTPRQQKKKYVAAAESQRPSPRYAEADSRLWIILPAIFTAFVAIAVFISERWLLGPYVNMPLDLPSALEGSWRNESVYRDRLWGTYRCVPGGGHGGVCVCVCVWGGGGGGGGGMRARGKMSVCVCIYIYIYVCVCVCVCAQMDVYLNCFIKFIAGQTFTLVSGHVFQSKCLYLSHLSSSMSSSSAICSCYKC